MTKTKWIGIIGYPLAHSLSKSFHEKRIEEKKLPVDFRVLEWDLSCFEDKIRSFRKDADCVGFSVTMPYKESIRSYCDEVDFLAEKTGVVNAVKNINGKWFGFNTDGPGFLDGFQKWETVPPKSATVILFGCGATSKTVSFVLAEQGYRKFIFINRTVEKAISWGERLRTYFNGIILRSAGGVTKDLIIPKNNVFILNTTPLFTEQGLWKGLNIEELIPPIWFFDVLYNPSSTWLLREFRRRSFHAMNGESMFESQARLSFKNWING